VTLLTHIKYINYKKTPAECSRYWFGYRQFFIVCK